MVRFTIWRLEDEERDLWLPTDCDTFDQAAQAWLDCIQSGVKARITEEIPVGLRDLRGVSTPSKSGRVGAQNQTTTIAQRAEMRQRLLAGDTPTAIIAEMGVTSKTVYQLQTRMRKAGELPRPPENRPGPKGGRDAESL